MNNDDISDNLETGILYEQGPDVGILVTSSLHPLTSPQQLPSSLFLTLVGFELPTHARNLAMSKKFIAF
eukprot:588392-Hanusia_phi.AAC.2